MFRAFFISILFSIGSLYATERPNILYFYVDDLGWGAIGPNGQEARKQAGLPNVLTPNLDQLAKQGLNFTRSYGATVCSPARSSQQTGFHQGHTFADRNDPNNAKKAMRAQDLTMGDVLSKAGYVTGYWGKWGYGGSKDQDNPSIDNVQTLPTTHGYHHVLAELHHVRAHTFFQPTLWSAPAKEDSVGGLSLKTNTLQHYTKDKIPTYPANYSDPKYPKVAYCDDTYAFEALKFVRAQSQNYHKTKQPFFALFAAQIPHAPFDEINKLPNWDQDYKNDPKFKKYPEQSQQYAAMVTRIDAHFGNILKALEDPNGDGKTDDSVVDNTLVIFQSDNGGPKGASRTTFKANGDLKGHKGSIYEGGIRVPTIVSWPAKINATSKWKAGSNIDYVMDVSDLLPTFCELAGTEAPIGLDGVSIAPSLTGKGEQRKRDYLIHEAKGFCSIIKGDYKLIIRDNSKKAKGPKTALYNLKTDAAEANNIFKEKPELVGSLKKLLIAEHVLEPAGFANTYHTWKGKNNADVSSADNWSEYIYENAGIEYMKEHGSPKNYWSAEIKNKTQEHNTAVVNNNVSFLGLHVKGNSKGVQELLVSKDGVLNASNELRISKHAVLNLDGGKVTSKRWIELGEGAKLKGNGVIEADVYMSSEARLDLQLTKQNPSLKVKGQASLAGALQVKLKDGPLANERILIEANEIKGKFENQKVELKGGAEYELIYTDKKVVLKKITLVNK